MNLWGPPRSEIIRLNMNKLMAKKKNEETPKSLSSSASKLRVISSYQCHFLYGCRMCLLIYFHYVALSKLSQSSALHCFTFPAVKLFFSVSFFNTCADGQEGVVWQPTLTFSRSRQANSVSPNVLWHDLGSCNRLLWLVFYPNEDLFS